MKKSILFPYALALAAVTACQLAATVSPKPAENTGAPAALASSAATAETAASPSPENPIPCNHAELLADLSIPDGWQIGPSATFTKTWRLQNIGSCTWDTSYELIFEGGDRMGAPDSVPLTAVPAAPGEVVEISLDLVSPADPGAYRGFFQLRSSDGHVFGIGPGVDGSFSASITVVIGEPELVSYRVAVRATLAPGASGDVTAECPAGTFAAGGGFGGDGVMVAHHQGLSADGWRVMAVNNSESERTLTAYAICLADISDVTVSQESGENTVYPDVLGQVNVPCPEGSVVSSLGYSYDPRAVRIAGGDFMVNTVRVFGSSLSGAQTLRGTAVCMAPSSRASSQLVSYTSLVPAGGSLSLEAACPDGTFISGGSFGGNIELVVTGLTKKNGDDVWIATANNPTGTELRLITSAVCMRIAMM